MSVTPVEIGRSADRVATGTLGCLAPDVHLYLAPDGAVRACCRNWDELGNVTTESLLDIWHGARRRTMAAALGEGRFEGGCGQCGAEIRLEGRPSSYPANFDRFAGDDRSLGEWPTRIEFNLSNACNLMCIQCDGFLSSSIRAHREHLPALPKAYSDQFFADLELFVPHLAEAQFAGGEPFLGRENFRVWEIMERLRPDLPISVVTNATQWNDRIERVGRALNMSFTFSIDSLVPATYHAIRVNSDLGVVMGNIARFMDVARDNGRECEINFCLMRQNLREFGELLLWADSIDVDVNVCVVRAPEHASVAAMAHEDLVVAARRLAREDQLIRSQLVRNRDVWVAEFERVTSWADAAPETRRKMWWSSDWWTPEHQPSAAASSLSLSAYRCTPGVRPDVEPERLRLAAAHPDARVHELTMDYEEGRADDHLIVAVDESLADELATTPSELIGQPLHVLLRFVEALHGPLVNMDVLDEQGHRTDVEVVHERVTVRTVSLAHADDLGRLAGATMLLAFSATGSSH